MGTNNTFQTGQTLACRSIGDSNCVWVFTVTKRTPKSLVIEDSDGKTRRVGIIIGYDGGEYVRPFGKFSMCPVLKPNDIMSPAS